MEAIFFKKYAFTCVLSAGQIYGGDFAKFYGLLRIYDYF